MAALPVVLIGANGAAAPRELSLPLPNLYRPGKQVAQRGLLIRACLASSVDRRSTAVAVFPEVSSRGRG